MSTLYQSLVYAERCQEFSVFALQRAQSRAEPEAPIAALVLSDLLRDGQETLRRLREMLECFEEEEDQLLSNAAQTLQQEENKP